MAIKSICTRSIDTIKIKREKKEISIYKIYNFVNVFFPNEESSNTTSQYRKFPPKKYTHYKQLKQFNYYLVKFHNVETPLDSNLFPVSPTFSFSIFAPR